MKLLITCIVLLVPLSVFAVTTGSSAGSAEQTDQHAEPTSHSSQANGGERVFKTNCARCHTPPMSLSPQITGTIVMHMRVRAHLSRRDEQLLLEYLAP
jgi:cytochrome c5